MPIILLYYVFDKMSIKNIGAVSNANLRQPRFEERIWSKLKLHYGVLERISPIVTHLYRFKAVALIEFL